MFKLAKAKGFTLVSKTKEDQIVELKQRIEASEMMILLGQRLLEAYAPSDFDEPEYRRVTGAVCNYFLENVQRKASLRAQSEPVKAGYRAVCDFWYPVIVREVQIIQYRRTIDCLAQSKEMERLLDRASAYMQHDADLLVDLIPEEEYQQLADHLATRENEIMLDLHLIQQKARAMTAKANKRNPNAGRNLQIVSGGAVAVSSTRKAAAM